MSLDNFASILENLKHMSSDSHVISIKYKQKNEKQLFFAFFF
jgi:hypothetical protein